MTTSLFEPAARLTDDLTGATPTWRLVEEPIYAELRAGWADFYARLCSPVDESPANVVEGHVLDGPPTAALTLVPTVAIDLEVTQPLSPPRECDDCAASGDEPCRTPSGRVRTIGDHVSRIRAVASKAATA